MKLDVIDTFEMYLAVKAHFTSKYDFFQYRGRINGKICTFDALMKKPYHGIIRTLSTRYEAKELCDYFVSNMLVDEGKYLFDIDAEGKRIYIDYLRRKESRTYIFKQDIQRVCMELEKLNKKTFWDCVSIENGQHPLLFRMFVGSYLAPESVCLLSKINNFLIDWDSKVSDTMFYPIVSNQLKKLSKFIRIKDTDVFAKYIDEATSEWLIQ